MITIKEFGPSCRCCGLRGMKRVGQYLYQCQRSGETFEMFLSARGLSMLKLETAKALREISNGI